MDVYSTVNEADGQNYIEFASGTSATPPYQPMLVYTLANPPAAPSALIISGNNAQVSLSWTASTDATSYSVLRSITNGSGYVAIATGITSASFTDTNVSVGETYYYVVQADDAGGWSGNSSQATVNVSNSPATDTPTLPPWAMISLAIFLVATARHSLSGNRTSRT